MTIIEKPGFLTIDDTQYQTRISSKFKNRIKYQSRDPKLILSFIPGTVLEIFVIPGQIVKKGDLLLILDAMKMQNRLKCNTDGKIKSIVTTTGERVPKGALLIELE